MQGTTDGRELARIFMAATSITRSASHFCGQTSTSEGRIVAEIPTPRGRMRRVGIVSGTEQGAFVFFETRSSRRGAAKMGAESRGDGTLRAEVKTWQALSVLPWLLLLVPAERKIEASAFRAMRNWRRHVQEKKPAT